MTDAPLTQTTDGSARLRTATTPGTRWLQHLQLWRPEDVDTIETGAHETAVILLRGTFDLMIATGAVDMILPSDDILGVMRDFHRSARCSARRR